MVARYEVCGLWFCSFNISYLVIAQNRQAKPRFQAVFRAISPKRGVFFTIPLGSGSGIGAIPMAGTGYVQIMKDAK